MSNVDNLNFKVILDDSEFNKKIEDDIKAAKRLNASLSEYLTIKQKHNKAKSRGSGNSAKEIAEKKRLIDLNTKETISQEKITQAKLKTAKAQQQLNKAISQSIPHYQTQGRLLGELGGLAATYFSIRGVASFVDELVKVTGQYQAQRAALRAILQDDIGADKLIGQMQDLALFSPYTFQDLTGYAKQLAAFGLPLDEIYDTTKRLADVSAGVGVDLSRIILAYGQVRSASFLKGSELRQFTEAGIPLLEVLAEQFEKIEGKSVSVGEVFDKISSRQVPFEMVAQAFKTMTDEGGKFYNMQETLASTVEGKVSNLRDAYEKMLYTIGENQSGIITGTIDGLKLLMENYEIIGKILVGLVTTYGTYKAALLSIKAINAVRNASKFVSDYIAMGRALGFATANMVAFNTASKTNIFIALASAVVGVVAALASFNKQQKEALRESGKAAQAFDEEATALKRLYEIAKDESKSKKERKDAISKINSEYGEYLDRLVDERDSVEQLSESYKKLSSALGEKYLREQNEVITGRQRESLNKAQSSLYGALSETLKKSGLGDEMQGKITSEIQHIINNFSRYWSSQEIYNKIIEKLQAAGGDVGERQKGKLFDSVSDFKKSQNTLLIAEESYNQFAKGYEASMRTISASSGEVAEEVRTTIQDIAKRIEAGNVEIAKLEKRAKEKGLTDKERNELSAMREQNEADRNEFKELAGYDYESISKETEKIARAKREQAKKLARETIKAEDEITLASIEAMDEGFNKKLALAELQHKQKLQELTWQYEDLQNKAEGSPDITPQFAKKITAEEIRYATEIAIIEEEMNKKRLESQREYMREYGSLKEKESAIILKYEEEIAKAKAEGDEYLAKTLDKKKQEELRELEKQYSGIYALIFADARDLTSSQLAQAIEFTQEEIKKAVADGDIEELTELYEQLNAAMAEQTQRDSWGFGGLVKGFKMLKKSSSNYNESISVDDGAGIEQALNERAAAMSLIEKSAKEISDTFGELGEALEELGGVAGEIGGVFKGISSNSENLVKAFTAQGKGDAISVALDSAMEIVTMITNQIVENRKAQEEWNMTVSQCAHEYAMLKLNALDYEQSNIFGVESPYKKAVESMKQYAEAMKMVQEKEQELAEGQVQTGTRQVVSGENVATGLVAGAAMGAALGSIIPGLGTAIGAIVGTIIGGIAGLLSTETVPIFENIADTYGSILKEGTDTFELNPKILADYEKLDDATKKIVDNWQEIRDKAIEAQEQMRESLTEMVGDMGNKLSDALVEAFTGGDVFDAVDSFKDHVTEVIEGITQQIIFSSIFQSEFEKLQKKMEDSFKPGGDMDLRDDMMDFVDILPGLLDQYETAMKQAQDAAASAGYNLFAPEVDTQNLGSGFQSLTEETGGLLASYVNAMRADLSANRTIISTHLPSINAKITSLMQHNAHMKAIAMNIEQQTLRIAQSNEQILSELQSVMTSEGGPTSIRIYS